VEVSASSRVVAARRGLVLGLVLLARPAAPASPVADPLASAELRLRADAQERVGKGEYKFRGFVDLVSGDLRVQADEAHLIETPKADGGVSRRLEAEGNVVFLRGDERMSGTKASIDLDTGRGVLLNARGYVSPGVFVEAKQIERLNADTYRVRGATFTSCYQPSPRWSFTASSATLKVDEHILARNVDFRIKNVPTPIFLPFFYYPIQESQRSTGLLFPQFGTSETRGFGITGAFFWAMSRSTDQTFFVENHSKYGRGYGHEFRYVRDSMSSGGFRTYLFRQKGGSKWDYDLRWNAVHLFPARVRGSVNVSIYSNTTFQENIQDNLELASSRTRRGNVSLSRLIAGNSVELRAERNDTFFSDSQGNIQTYTQDRLPSLRVNRSPLRLGKTGLQLGWDASTDRLRNTGQIDTDFYSRFDATPYLMRPLAASFLQLTPRVAVRYTRYGGRFVDREVPPAEEGAAPTTETVFEPTPLERRYFESTLELSGPKFAKVFDNPSGFYSDRFKHEIGPYFIATYRSRGLADDVRDDQVPAFDGLDFAPATRQLQYGLLQLLYAKRKEADGKSRPYQFLSWNVFQTYYKDPNASLFDQRYSSSLFDRSQTAQSFSPISSRVSFRPTKLFYSSFDTQWVVRLRRLQSLSVAAGANYSRFRMDGRWSRRFRLQEDSTSIPITDTLSGSARIEALPKKVTLEGRGAYDLIRKELYSASGMFRYDVQCCGFMLAVNRISYGGRSETRKIFQIQLANIGSVGTFNAQDAGGPMGFGYGGRP
jgi:lipopolysaccharide assembly outer membrane protein LptD (OstA)